MFHGPSLRHGKLTKFFSGSSSVRIGFLFNHDQVHQLRHSLPIAMEVAKRHAFEKVVVLTGSPRMTAEVRAILKQEGVHLDVEELTLRSATGKMFDIGLNWLIPARKFALYRENLDVFRALDVLVVAEKTSAVLTSRYGLSDLKIIHTRHGAGDRAIGFNRASAKFDKVLVAGEAIRERLVHEAGVQGDRIAIVGYPKFDLMSDAVPLLPFKDKSRRTVLYNPHVAPHLSSWFRQGRAVLEFFSRSQDYNLIFAPHVMLFHRPLAITISPPRVHWRGEIPKRILNATNIHVDTSSSSCTDMSYTRAADIYLGDVSSQVYEFLLKPRPCIFLDVHGRADHENDPSFAHWAAGDVIEDVSQLDGALRAARTAPDRYGAVQRELFRSHINLTDQRSSTRAAIAVEQFAFSV